MLLNFAVPLVVLALGAVVGIALSKWLARHVPDYEPRMPTAASATPPSATMRWPPGRDARNENGPEPFLITPGIARVRCGGRRARRPEGPEGYMGARQRLATSLVSVALVIAVGTIALMIVEGWPAFDALYMVVTTVTTVGFGEIGRCPLPAGRS